MKRLALILLLALTAAPAWGATYWLRPGGANGRTPTLDGSDSTAAHALSLSWANDSLTAGDTARLSWGNYGTSGIRPKHTGNPSAGEWLRFIGDTLSPAKVIVYDVTVDSINGAKRCVVVEGVTTNSMGFKTTGCSYAGYDTVAKCIVLGNLDIHGRSNMTLRDCTVGTGDAGDKLSINTGLPTGFGYTVVDNGDGTWTATSVTNNQSFRSHVVDSLYIGYNTFNLATSSGPNAIDLRQVGSSHFVRNRSTLSAIGAQDTHLNTIYDCRNNTFSDNYYEGFVANPSSIHYLLNLRDNATFNVFERDTFVQSEASLGNIKIGLSTAGNDWDDGSKDDLPPPQTDVTRSGAITKLVGLAKTYDYGDSNNTFSECVMRVGNVIECQSRADNNAYLFNRMIGSMFLLGNMQLSDRDSAANDSVVWRHNTIVSTGPLVITPTSKINHGVFSQNIVYALEDVTKYWTCTGHYGFGTGSSFTSCDSNLVWCTSPQDSAKAFDTGKIFGGCTYSPIGMYNGNPAGPWGAMFGYDLYSHWGDPEFRDTLSIHSFDFTPSPTGLAYSTDLWKDHYVGAVAASGDATAPVVTITAPSGSKLWTTGEVMHIQWTATDNTAVSSITLEWANVYSPTAWSTITSGLSASTSDYYWTLPVFGSSYGNIRVTAYDDAGNPGYATVTFHANASDEDIGPSRDSAVP